MTIPRTAAGLSMLAVEFHSPKGPCYDSPDCEHGHLIRAIEDEAARMERELIAAEPDPLLAEYEAVKTDLDSLLSAAQDVVTRWFEWFEGEADQTLRQSMIRLRAAITDTGERTNVCDMCGAGFGKDHRPGCPLAAITDTGEEAAP